MGDLQQRAFWDDHAADYDRSMSLVERWLLADTRDWICSRARGATLEIAIGTGLNLERYGPGIGLVGLDLSGRMLAQARRRADGSAHAVDLVQGSAQALPLRTASMDTVVCTLALCSIPDVALALTEMARVLVPGGRLLLADHVVSTWPPIAAGQRLLDRWTVPRFGEHFSRRPAPMLEACGFGFVESERLRAGVVERVLAVKL